MKFNYHFHVCATNLLISVNRQFVVPHNARRKRVSGDRKRDRGHIGWLSSSHYIHSLWPLAKGLKINLNSWISYTNFSENIINYCKDVSSSHYPKKKMYLEYSDNLDVLIFFSHRHYEICLFYGCTFDSLILLQNM